MKTQKLGLQQLGNKYHFPVHRFSANCQKASRGLSQIAVWGNQPPGGVPGFFPAPSFKDWV
jgi:hypothetical protein